MRPNTLAERRRLYLIARAVVARHYRRPLTLVVVARALSCSPRQLQRAYALSGELTFQEDLHARRMAAAAALLAEQPSLDVRDVARLVGFRQAPHFARAFRRAYGLPPARFRERARRARGRPHSSGARPFSPGSAQPVTAADQPVARPTASA